MDLVPVLLNTTVERAADARDRFTEGDTDRARLRLEEVASATAVLLRLLASLHPGSPVADELDAERFICIPKSLVGMSGRPDTRPATHAPSDELDQAALARSLLPLGMFDPAATFGGTLQHPFGPAIVHDSPSPPPRAAQLPGQDGQPPGAETQPFAVLNLPHVAQALDDIFFKFLARICSDPLFKDPSGERLNASTYSAKRASKADELLEFMTFKFKVRPFTDAFVHQVGLNPEFAAVDAQPQSDPPAQPNNRNNRNGSGSGSGNGSNSNNSNPQQPLSLPPRHAQTLATTPRLSESALHMYIRQHRFLCRYRAKDGRLVKSSGRCCFLVNARKSASDEWVFCEFEPFLGGEEPPSTIQIGQSFSYTPLVVDPQHKDIKAAFHSPWLPHWLRWRDGTLVGIPDINSRSCEITVVAVFALPGQGARRTLERTIEITVLPAVASDAGGGGRRPRTVDRRAVGSAAM
nr:hypothetical protein HK105_006076 [Polyrhizophydium stewartii]